jgi:hypothetical protein
MTTKHDAGKAIANIYVTKLAAAASAGQTRAFEARHRQKQERLMAARAAEKARNAKKAAAAAEEAPPTDAGAPVPPKTSG